MVRIIASPDNLLEIVAHKIIFHSELEQIYSKANSLHTRVSSHNLKKKSFAADHIMTVTNISMKIRTREESPNNQEIWTIEVLIIKV